MLSKLLAALCLCLAADTAIAEFRHFSDWTTEEKAWFTTYAASSYIDYRQTSWALNQRDVNGKYLFEEANPLLGKRPSSGKIAAFKLLGVAGLYYGIGEMGFSDKEFAWAAKAAVLVQAGVVVHNDSIGVSINVAF